MVGEIISVSIYGINGSQLNAAYDVQGDSVLTAFDTLGNIVFQVTGSWEDEISVEKYRDSATSTAYYVIIIPQTRPDGTVQYPFVFVPNGSGGGTQSTYQMVQQYGWYMGMNGGYFDYSQSSTYKPYGITIENGTLIREYTGEYFRNNYTLTIDQYGTLGYEITQNQGLTAEDLLAENITSSLLGLVPLVINGQAADVESQWWTNTERAQRQIIGQYPNGDYCVVTCEGRNYDSSPGFTVSEARTLCLDMGLQFAMAVDGGGSTETVIGDHQLNKVYNGSTGRIVPTYIVFNGTDQFFVPNE